MEEQNGSNILSNLPDRIRKIISNTVAALLVAMLLMLLFVAYRSIAARYSGVTETGYMMGTFFEIKVNGENSAAHVNAALAKIREIDGMIDYYDDKSELSSINNMAGISPVSISHDTYDVIDKALRFSRRSGGSFDLTMGPLVDIWSGAFRDHNQIPAGNELVYAQHLVNYGNVAMNPQNETVKLMYPGMKIDLEDVCRGYAISKARAILVDKGVKSAVISAGPSMAVIGDNKGKPWKVGIKDPRHPDELVGVITLQAGQAVSTAGDYETYFEVGGKRYHKILDPATGMPGDQCRAVTIISDDAAEADMLSKAVFIMGPKRGLVFVSTFPNDSAVIIDKDGAVTTSTGVKLER